MIRISEVRRGALTPSARLPKGMTPLALFLIADTISSKEFIEGGLEEKVKGARLQPEGFRIVRLTKGLTRICITFASVEYDDNDYDDVDYDDADDDENDDRDDVGAT